MSLIRGCVLVEPPGEAAHFGKQAQILGVPGFVEVVGIVKRRGVDAGNKQVVEAAVERGALLEPQVLQDWSESAYSAWRVRITLRSMGVNTYW